MKTLFQISTQRPQGQPGLQSPARSQATPSLVSQKISVSGPQGPSSPVAHQLSAMPRKAMRSSGTPIRRQAAYETSSRSTPLPPPKQETPIRSGGSASHSAPVRNSQLQAIDSSLK